MLDERARSGRALQVRVIRPDEAEALRRARHQYAQARSEYHGAMVRLYLAGVSQTSIAAAIGTSAQNVGNMIRRRRRWLGLDV